MKSAWLKNVPRKICVYLWNLWDKIFIGFHGWIGRQYCLSDYSRICADIWPLANGSRPICAAIVFGHADFADDADFSSWEVFVPQISQIYTDFLWNLWWSALSNPRGYLQRPNRSPPRNSVSSDDKKNLRHLRNLRDKKTSQEKSVYICEICGTFYNLRGYLKRPDRSPPRNSVSNRRSRKSPNKFRVVRW